MNKNEEKICLIIPTIGNFKNILRLLHSINEQTFIPNQVIIVDSSGLLSWELFKNIFPNLNITYVKSKVCSLTYQRNISLEKVNPSITLVGFLDDDIILEKDAIEKMLSFWANAGKEVGGCGFNIINAPESKGIFLKTFFCMEDQKKGIVLKSGFNSPNHPVNKNIQTSWLCGGATVWRREIFKEYKFDNTFKGYGFCEDLEFSYRVGKIYKLFIASEAKVRHFPNTSKRNLRDSYLLGKTQVKGRVYFVMKNPELSLTLCLWANLGRFSIDFYKGVLGLDKRNIVRSIGILMGIIETFVKRNKNNIEYVI